MRLKYPLILGSKSPRRQELLKGLGLEFTVRDIDIDEAIPGGMTPIRAAIHLAEKKAGAGRPLTGDEILLTADTVVAARGKIYGKPSGEQEGINMLSELSGGAHDVITGVCLLHKNRLFTAHELTRVFFRILSEEEIRYYVTHYRPFDKAGGYGIQEWIGMAGIDKIEGSYFNVVG